MNEKTERSQMDIYEEAFERWEKAHDELTVKDRVARARRVATECMRREGNDRGDPSKLIADLVVAIVELTYCIEDLLPPA